MERSYKQDGHDDWLAKRLNDLQNVGAKTEHTYIKYRTILHEEKEEEI